MTTPRTVVLLHGIFRAGTSMRALEKALAADGFATVNLTYPSRKMGLVDLGAWLERTLQERSVAGPVGFVTHSMGSLVCRSYAARPNSPALARTVFIAPPSRGALEADRASKLLLHRTVLGPAVLDMRTHLPPLPVPSCEL